MITVKNLGEGEMPLNQGVLYECPLGLSAIVMDINISNVGSISAIFTLIFKKNGGGFRSLMPYTPILQVGTMFQYKGRITMSGGDQIRGQFADFPNAHYVISGIERS